MYSKASLDSYYFRTKGFYIFHIPINVPYKQIYSMADSLDLKQKEAFGPILESGKGFGWGWIGVEIEKSSEIREDVFHLTGDFQTYEYQGPYRTLGKAYKQIRKDFPKAKEYYNLYLDDPDKTEPQQCRTRILFR